jgi:hypothetical protein
MKSLTKKPVKLLELLTVLGLEESADLVDQFSIGLETTSSHIVFTGTKANTPLFSYPLTKTRLKKLLGGTLAPNAMLRDTLELLIFGCVVDSLKAKFPEDLETLPFIELTCGMAEVIVYNSSINSNLGTQVEASPYMLQVWDTYKFIGDKPPIVGGVCASEATLGVTKNITDHTSLNVETKVDPQLTIFDSVQALIENLATTESSLILLKDAKNVDEEVRGSSESSVYTVALISPHVKLAYRIQPKNLSLRAESVSSKFKTILKKVGFEDKGLYLSVHIQGDQQTQTMYLGALLYLLSNEGVEVDYTYSFFKIA